MYIGEKMNLAIEILSMEFSKNMFNKSEFKKIQTYKKLIFQGDEKAIDEVIDLYGNN